MTPQQAATAASVAGRRKQSKAPLANKNPATSDRHYDPDELEFLAAVSEYQQRTGRKFPTFCELFAILKSLGYSKSGADPCTTTTSR